MVTGAWGGWGNNPRKHPKLQSVDTNGFGKGENSGNWYQDQSTVGDLGERRTKEFDRPKVNLGQGKENGGKGAPLSVRGGELVG